MTFLITLACTAAACVLLREPLRKVPWLFYLLAVAATVLFFARDLVDLPRTVNIAVIFMMQKCMLATALFIVVMYIGVLPKNSKARHWMQPARAPLSIIACILALGHMVRYIVSYMPRILGGTVTQANVIVSFAIAIVLFVLLIVLGVTSFQFIKRRMNGMLWKRVQQFAYLFYALVYIHLLIMLGPSALHGGENAIVSVVIYTLIFGAYVVLRILRARADRAVEPASKA